MYISTGSPFFDTFLSGGLLRGAITEFYGGCLSGKTSLGISSAESVLANNGYVGWLDTYNTFSSKVLRGEKKFVLFKTIKPEPDFFSELFQTVIEKNIFDLFVVDGFQEEATFSPYPGMFSSFSGALLILGTERGYGKRTRSSTHPLLIADADKRVHLKILKKTRTGTLSEAVLEKNVRGIPFSVCRLFFRYGHGKGIIQTEQEYLGLSS